MKKIILAILVVLWMAFIFNMSSEDGNQSSSTSGQTIENVLSVVPEFEKQPEEVKKDVISNLQFVVRKSAHFIGYMILGILVFIFIYQFEDINKKFIISWIICIIYAASDEIHQLFVPGRSGQVRDVLIDSAGSFLGIFLMTLCTKLLYSFKNRLK